MKLLKELFQSNSQGIENPICQVVALIFVMLQTLLAHFLIYLELMVYCHGTKAGGLMFKHHPLLPVRFLELLVIFHLSKH
jgi:hypothetical protein